MNRLQFETSPYLLQHAHNPVEWFAWKPEAFEKAKAENKPILVSIGYSTCHWCHVMERESFENQEVAALMNERFVNIKVDREERPDVDQIYMEACQLISGSGGWPLNCFLTPAAKPFYAGTYFPPEPMYNRPSWTQTLIHLSDAFRNQRDVVEEQAEKLTDMIRDADKQLIQAAPGLSHFGADDEEEIVFLWTSAFTTRIFRKLQRNFDLEAGGFGGAPKFPGTFSLNWLLEYYFYTGEEAALEHVVLSLDQMTMGGIYDQLAGGFSRYSTDRHWFAPHFEKMLYDNALIVGVMSEAYKITKKPLYERTLRQTLGFLLTDMRSPAGGFYSAYDADSEGVEGKYYVWNKREIDEVLGPDAALFNELYNVEDEGNWEGHNILFLSKTVEEYAGEKGLSVNDLLNILSGLKTRLLERRSLRIKPSLDDKILLAWNALAVSAFAKAHQALGPENQGEADYKTVALETMEFLLKHFKKDDGLLLYHTYKNGTGAYEAFLDDYALLIEALLDVYSISFDSRYLYLAADFCDFTIKHFYDPSDGLFFYTAANQPDIILRKKELYDNATPSGNSTMASNLTRLGVVFDRTDYKKMSLRMFEAIGKALQSYPSSFGKWASTALTLVKFPVEIAVAGPEAVKRAEEINARYLPHIVVMAAATPQPDLPLLKDKIFDGETWIYVCKNYSCSLPVKMIEQIDIPGLHFKNKTRQA